MESVFIWESQTACSLRVRVLFSFFNVWRWLWREPSLFTPGICVMLWAAAEKDTTLVCLGYYNKTTQTGSLYTTGLEAGSLWSRCWLIWFREVCSWSSLDRESISGASS